MGILKTAAKVGVASAVHGRVQRRQQQRWAAQDAAAAATMPVAQPVVAAAPAPAPAPAPAAATQGIDDQIERLTKLAQLREAGVLTDEEFAAKKAQILAL